MTEEPLRESCQCPLCGCILIGENDAFRHMEEELCTLWGMKEDYD